ncbi:PfkB family carbohydrate kinase [Lentzea sp. BCCO 10_0798]|uniref:PfkB family carbohydrate kinase n=1 Tax=Lentzea kristufekii TaxID=3095430 RepID=A0ABU4TX46_9PSEU|nr:PfkB family carbohydrate kinase [Lentzea sp. BCCO 10_0798]MDX8052619.1 PfkB family carbohydrate kinase [Lentzea sp. BCCO 10_0798]
MDARVAVFAPSPQLTITVEDLDGEPDVHLHAGGQGFWQSRMIAALGVEAVVCATFGGETGRVLRTLLEGEHVDLKARDVAARNGAYVHDRRDGSRDEMVEMLPDALSRHELDDVYESALVEGIRAGTAVLSGPSDDRVLPHDTYFRLTSDLTGNGCRVIVDLAGDRLAEAVRGGPDVVKVSHEELGEEELTKLIQKAREIASSGVHGVVVSRADEPALALLEDQLYLVRMPQLEPVDTRGAGDSMTAGISAGLALGMSLTDAVKLGAAAGAVNVTRHGLGSGGGEAVRELSKRVELEPIEE